jgi:hypothetical protein
MKAEPDTSLRWYSIRIDSFLDLDIDEVLVELDFQASARSDSR